MKYCKRCLSTNLRPNAFFRDGICIACLYSEDANHNTGFLLKELEGWLVDVKRARRVSSKFDCIVGVSGGKDSTRQALWVRDRLNLNPLLVCVAYPPKQMSQVGAQNISNLITHNFDIMTINPAPQTSKELSLYCFENFGNVCTATEQALFSGVPRIAIENNVPLIFWGENPALQVGDAAVAGRDSFDGNNLRKLNTLQSPLARYFNKSNQYKQNNYIYPSEAEYEKACIQIIYLGAAWDDWGNELNSELAALQGLSLRPGEKSYTGDISEASMVDEEFTNINMMLKYYKYGFGRATDLVCEQIRAGRLSREDAIEIVKKYDGICDEMIIRSYCSYVGVDLKEFWNIAYKFVNWDIFELKGKSLRPTAKFKPGENYGG